MTRILAILCGLLLGLNITAQAQGTLKFGHINSTQLLSLMPETKNADSSLQKFGQSLENQLKTMTAEYQGKISDFKSKEASMAEPIRDAKLKEISDLEERIQSFQESAQSSMQKKKEELYTPILKKAEEAINAVAKDNKFSYIFDTSAGTLLFAQEGDDVLPLVKGKLGLK
ncbi:MAG: OmpH family outer membrane protein [Bacteroidia bacterium]|nr:OmpH family outer membrane protein [Bacteroidia bacterium]